MRKPVLIAAALVLVVVCAGGGWNWWNVWRFLQATDDAYVQSDVTLISPKVEGYIKEVKARDNEPVTVGQVLFVIDDRDFAAKAAQADAALGKARAALATEQNQLAVLQSQKREEEAKLMQARAALQLAKNDLDNTVIRAPVAGIAGNRAGQIGQYVKPGTQLLSLVPLPRVYVTANFKETQLTRMRPGQPAEISVDAYPDRPLHGQVESFAPGSGAQFSLLPPDNATGNFTKIVQRVPVRIAVPADDPMLRLLRPGLSVTVTIDTRREGAAEASDGIVGAAHAGPASPEARPSP